MKQPKICKCGHGKEHHYKHPENTIKFLTGCQSCACTEYMNRRRPDGSDKAFLIIGVIMIGFFAFAAVSPFLDSHLDLDQTISIHARTIFLILGGILALFCIYVISPFMIESYFTAKKRKEYPIASQ